MRRPFPRFSELDLYGLNVEHHAHTTRTDGTATIEESIATARQRGLRSLAFTEHVRRDTDWFADFAREIRTARREAPAIEVLIGCEAKALDPGGDLDASDAILRECDIVLGSVHRFPDGRGGVLRFEDVPQAELAETETELALGLLRNAPIDVLAHPGGMYQRRHGSFPEPLMRRILEASLERGIAVEISTSYLREVEPFLRLCSEVDPFVSIGSDAHRLSDIGRCRDVLQQQPLIVSE